MTRGNILIKAHKIINGERQQQYGNAEDSFAVIAELWNGYYSAKMLAINELDYFVPFTAKDVAIYLSLMKIGRELNGAGKEDNFIDMAGYIALASDMAKMTHKCPSKTS